MMVLLDTSHNLKEAEKEIGCTVHQLLTPLTRFRPQYPAELFAIDNGAFSSFKSDAFLALLAREEPRKHLCKFVAVPDVVASARRTLECFDFWYPKLQTWPIALVAQDGQQDLPIPWNKLEAIFIGGTTEFKMSAHAAQIIKTAKIMDKWAHVGRVNTPGRFEYFEGLGADSIDGSGIARFSWMREEIRDRDQQPKLQLAAQ